MWILQPVCSTKANKRDQSNQLGILQKGPSTKFIYSFLLPKGPPTRLLNDDDDDVSCLLSKRANSPELGKLGEKCPSPYFCPARLLSGWKPVGFELGF